MTQETETNCFQTPGEHFVDGVRFAGIIPAEVLHHIQREFTFKDNDVVLITYPKSGTTWMQTILYLLTHPEEVKAGTITVMPFDAVPHLEKHTGDISGLELVAKMPSPRYIKTHLAYPFLQRALSNSKTKVIVVIRNPKDVLVSLFHFRRLNRAIGNFPGTWGDFFQMFLHDHLTYGTWYDHIVPYWNLRERDNFLNLTFEDMKKNPVNAIKQVASFIDKTITDDQAEKIAEMTSFKKMSEILNPRIDSIPIFDSRVSQFMRKGEVGDWKNYFTVAQNEIFDREYKQRMKHTGFNLRFE